MAATGRGAGVNIISGGCYQSSSLGKVILPNSNKITGNSQLRSVTQTNGSNLDLIGRILGKDLDNPLPGFNFFARTDANRNGVGARVSIDVFGL